MKGLDSNSRLVYSTSKPKGDSVVRLRYETKGRKGKGMTLIVGLSLNEDGLLELSKQLKQRFGTGGTVKNYIIELQGDFREQAAQELRRLGYTVKT